MSKNDLHADVVVLGSGPGGYSAAFRAADLGLNVILAQAGMFVAATEFKFKPLPHYEIGS